MRTAADGTVYHLLYDGHGNTRALLTETGGIYQRYAFDAWGNQNSGGVTGLTSAEDAATRLLYSGEQTDRTGLQYLRARYYHPRTGRFLALDPFAGNTQDPISLHKYLYTTGDPILFADPTGRFEGLVGLSAANSIANVLIGLELATFNAIDATVEGARAGLDAHQIFIGTLLDDVLGAVDLIVYTVAYAINIIESGINFVVGKDGQLQNADGLEQAALGSFLFASYNSLRRPSAIYQANHLNTDAAWGSSRGGPIPYGEGASVTLQGSKNQVGSEHFRFHLEMERFYDRHREINRKPTTDEYNRALDRALRAAGATGAQAKSLVEYAKAQQMKFGYSGKRLIPRLPEPDSFLKRFL